MPYTLENYKSALEAVELAQKNTPKALQGPLGAIEQALKDQIAETEINNHLLQMIAMCGETEKEK